MAVEQTATGSRGNEMGLKPSFGVSCRPILLSVNLAWKVCGRQGCLFPASSPVARESGDEGSDGDGKGRKSFPSLSARASRLLFLTAPHWALGKAVVEEAGLFHLLSLTLPSTLMVHSKRDLLYRNTGRHVKKSNKSWKNKNTRVNLSSKFPNLQKQASETFSALLWRIW